MRFQDIFLRNFWWKLGSVALATLIWINYVYPRSKILRAGKPFIPVELTVVPVASAGDVREFKADPPVVTVRLEGEENELKHVNPADLHARVFVAEAMKTNGARLDVEVSGLPRGISVADIVPDKVKIYAPPAP